jgi:hypothetical protein
MLTPLGRKPLFYEQAVMAGVEAFRLGRNSKSYLTIPRQAFGKIITPVLAQIPPI